MRSYGQALFMLMGLGAFALAAGAADTPRAVPHAAGQLPALAGPAALLQPGFSPELELGPETAAEPVCDRSKAAALMAALREKASAASPSVEIDCPLTLPEGMVITKRLIFKGAKASGVTVTGAGVKGALIDGGPGTFHHQSGFATKMVQIVSDNCHTTPTGEGRCSRPVNVTLRNLRIRGSVGISVAPGFDMPDKDYVRSFRLSAPANVLFDRVTITGLGLPCEPNSGDCNLLYLFAGVTHFRMINSEINGSTSDTAVAIYLDDVAMRNTFRSNRILARTTTRESISIDSSSENVFVNNHIHVSSKGGIFLYRNCGENGTTRRGTPRDNALINNVFTIPFGKFLPAIVVGSRNGQDTPAKNCPPNAVDPNPFFDLARFNAVMQNRVITLPTRQPFGHPDLIAGSITAKHPEVNTPNFIKENEVVERANPRRAGCFIRHGYPDFIRDSEFVNVFHNGDGEPFCTGFRYTCRDGELARSIDASCQASQIVSTRVQCVAKDSNKGCRDTVTAPRGKKLIGFKAACNLEFGDVSDADVDQVPANMLKVLRASDKPSEGHCILGGTSISTGEASVGGLLGKEDFAFGCGEKDANGGDCQIKARLFFH
ncbi:hypothetical protein [Ideonella alba]|uniref:Right handed beta helix domain-containing protein n=1 Tax=Ideonella alba TaxID=2824118 RepID=A0A940YBE9_9BURK|nr:hypothetical protein [Ideonella alba]MBQ0933444.1 hypothetical protein [Ideonella alba]